MDGCPGAQTQSLCNPMLWIRNQKDSGTLFSIPMIGFCKRLLVWGLKFCFWVSYCRTCEEQALEPPRGSHMIPSKESLVSLQEKIVCSDQVQLPRAPPSLPSPQSSFSAWNNEATDATGLALWYLMWSASQCPAMYWQLTKCGVWSTIYILIIF